MKKRVFFVFFFRILTKGAQNIYKVNKAPEHGRTALHMAVYNNDMDSVYLILGILICVRINGQYDI